MNYTLYVDAAKPAVAAAILRERALLQAQGKVYVRPYVRRWPGGLTAAIRSMKKRRKRGSRVLSFRRQRAA